METAILDIWTPDNGDDYALVQDLARVADDVEEAILKPPYIRLTRTSDATPSSTDHAFQIGPDDGANLVMDNNEIMARDAGNASTLNINIDGGMVRIGAATSDVVVRGRFVTDNYTWAESRGSVSSGSFSGAAGTVASVSVTFPVGRFTQAPNVQLTLNSTAPQARAIGASGISTAGMTINQFSDSTTRSTVMWAASQFFESSASG